MASYLFGLISGSATKENSEHVAVAAPKVKSKGEQYSEMTDKIVVQNLTWVFYYTPGLKLTTDKKTGALTEDNNFVLLQPIVRVNNGFATDCLYKTYMRAIEILKSPNNPYVHLKANFEESLKAKAGFDRMIDYYSSYYLSDRIALELKEIKAEVLKAKAEAKL
jgi:hypothetical protein